MNTSEARRIRRVVARYRRAGDSDATIARHLTAAELTPPAGPRWVAAGVGPRWTAAGVTRFMRLTRHVAEATPKPAKPKPVAASSPSSAGPHRRIYTAAPGTIPWLPGPDAAVDRAFASRRRVAR